MKVIDGTNMMGIISELNPNKRAILTVARNNKEIDIPVIIGLRPKLESN
jgi:hypothetical protein